MSNIKTAISLDEGIRESSLEKLATLRPVLETGIHTAGSWKCGIVRAASSIAHRTR